VILLPARWEQMLRAMSSRSDLSFQHDFLRSLARGAEAFGTYSPNERWGRRNVGPWRVALHHSQRAKSLLRHARRYIGGEPAPWRPDRLRPASSGRQLDETLESYRVLVTRGPASVFYCSANVPHSEEKRISEPNCRLAFPVGH
jgi:hypothetical protein